MDREKLLKTVKVFGWLGAAFWTGVWITTAIMLVSFGVWAFVAWALVFLVWTWHMSRIAKVYTDLGKPKQKWEQVVNQNVTFNVSTDLTEEQIATAVERATDVKLTYGL